MISTFRNIFSAATSGPTAIRFVCAAIFLACAGNSQSFAITTTAQGGAPGAGTFACSIGSIAYNNTGSTSATGSMTCSAGGVFSASGSAASGASAGHAGASADTTTTGGAADSHFGASAIYSDVFVFHSSNPALTNTSVTLNLNAAGTMSVGGPFANASVELTANVNTFLVGRIFSTIDATAPAGCSSTFSGAGGCTGSAFTGGSLVTTSTIVPLDMNVLVQLFLQVGAVGQASGSSASSVFGESLDFPIGTALFNLDPGVTVNAADSFVTNNIFAPPTSATPLPAALPLFATGLGALGLLGWRRKKKAAALAA